MDLGYYEHCLSSVKEKCYLTCLDSRHPKSPKSMPLPKIMHNRRPNLGTPHHHWRIQTSPPNYRNPSRSLSPTLSLPIWSKIFPPLQILTDTHMHTLLSLSYIHTPLSIVYIINNRKGKKNLIVIVVDRLVS